MMNFKLSVFITLALFALTVLSQQQDPNAVQGSNPNTASPAPDTPKDPILSFLKKALSAYTKGVRGQFDDMHKQYTEDKTMTAYNACMKKCDQEPGYPIGCYNRCSLERADARRQ